MQFLKWLKILQLTSIIPLNNFKLTKNGKKKRKATLVNLLGYEETINFAKNLKKKIDQQIKKYGNKANDLLDSVEFILKRKF